MDIYEEGQKLLEESEVLALLSPFGEATLSGSYVYRTMVDRDIDIDVVIADDDELDYDLRSTIGAELLRLQDLRSLQMSDPYHFPQFSQHKIMGFWFGLKLISAYTSRPWNIDIWFLHKDGNNEEDLELTQKLLHLSKKQRETIVKLKRMALEQGMKQKGDTSIKIYRAVLFEGVTTYEEFKRLDT